MSRTPSTFVCAVCGLPVIRWVNAWKHVGNMYQTSCGKAPRPQLRSAYEAELKAIIDHVKGRPS